MDLFLGSILRKLHRALPCVLSLLMTATADAKSQIEKGEFLYRNDAPGAMGKSCEPLLAVRRLISDVCAPMSTTDLSSQ
jgi:hypothetical protein